jgi:hypothetical protein
MFPWDEKHTFIYAGFGFKSIKVLPRRQACI